MTDQPIRRFPAAMNRVTTAVLACVADVAPAELLAAERLLARLPPDRWFLEWHLALWLGDAFGLDAATAEALTIGNILGLGAIRLRDDLADDEIPAPDVAAATNLSDALYAEALEPYRRRFAPESPFWVYLESCMATWQQGARDTSPASLAGRGAPLKISAFAICQLTRRDSAFATVERSLDHALAALALYDDLADWRADLEAGRWNAFVDAASGLPQTTANRALNRTRVLVARLSGEALTPYVRRIDSEFEAATRDARAVGIGPMAAALRDRRRAIAAQASALEAHHRDVGRQASDLLRPPNHHAVTVTVTGTV